MQTETWQEKVARKQQQCRDAIPKEWLLPSSILDALDMPLESKPNRLMEMNIPKKSGLFTDRELDITENYTVAQLLKALASGEMTSFEVTIAFSKRAAVAQQLTSCLTETMFEQAQERAKYLDESRASGKPLGPLHGLPVSIKDSFQVKGVDASIGFVSFMDKKSTINSPLVEILLQLGAVIYVKTNIPQTLMTADSHNNIYGRCLNPHNTAINAGGSSGGEGALVAFRGSPIGVGTDIAGSIRIPALCCGTYGFKPTASRVPYGGQVGPAMPGLGPILACAGPLANDFEAMAEFTKAIIDAVPALYDASCFDIPWRSIGNLPAKLTVGIVPEDPGYPLHPPAKRALEETIRRVEAAGHQIVRLSSEECRIADTQLVAMGMFGLDPKTSLNHINASGEPVIPSYAKGYKPAAGTPGYMPDLSTMEPLQKLALMNVKRLELQNEWRQLWQNKKIDVCIAPSSQGGAVSHDTFQWPAYTCFLNFLDYPACVIPFSKSSKALDPEPFKPNESQITPEYNPELVDGAPCSVQIFSSRMRDEECLALARVIDNCLKG